MLPHTAFSAFCSHTYLARHRLRFGAFCVDGGFHMEGLVELSFAGSDVALEPAEQAMPQRVQPLPIQDASLW